MNLTAKAYLLGFGPYSLTRVAFEVMQRSATVARLCWPDSDSRLACQEFENKLQAFRLFEYVDAAFSASAPLPELIAQVTTLEPFHSVWAMEGLGHFATESVWRSNGEPLSLLTDERLLERSLVPLHAGMGLSLANHVLARHAAYNRDERVPQTLQEFMTLCQRNTKVGYLGATYEALGLVARNLYPQLVRLIDRQLAELDEKLLGYFWHGVGRALYFAPTSFVPCVNANQRALERAEREPPHELGRRNALAGLAWALTLINIRQPQVMAGIPFDARRVAIWNG